MSVQTPWFEPSEFSFLKIIHALFEQEVNVQQKKKSKQGQLPGKYTWCN